MNPWIAYALGLATLPALFLVWVTVAWVIEQFTSTSKGWGCGNCKRRWGYEGDGSVVGVARFRAWWHFHTAHPGIRGRDVVAIWRGWDRRADWTRFRRMDRAYPAPPVTAVDVLARIPLLSGIVYALAYRHGRKATP